MAKLHEWVPSPFLSLMYHSVFDAFIRKYIFFLRHNLFQSENFYIWKQNMPFWHFRAPILISIPGPPLPWNPSTKVSNWSSWNCTSWNMNINDYDISFIAKKGTLKINVHNFEYLKKKSLNCGNPAWKSEHIF